MRKLFRSGLLMSATKLISDPVKRHIGYYSDEVEYAYDVKVVETIGVEAKISFPNGQPDR